MGYEEAPWLFKGRALYQLQLVKVSEARKYVPDALKLVNFFGYTLGGFYLARYTDSPVGAFDELVAVAGLVWNPPGSCAWAARVYVNDRTARNHGLQHVGLPSRVARFAEDKSVSLPWGHDWWRESAPNKQLAANRQRAQRAQRGRSTIAQQAQQAPPAATDRQPPGSSTSDDHTHLSDHPLVLWNAEGSPWWRRQRNAKGLEQAVCRLTLPPAPCGWPGPRMTVLLPSFSGATEDCPEILQYTCRLQTNVRPSKAAELKVTEGVDSAEALAPILGGRPLIALHFDNMVMSVAEPSVLTQHAHLPNRQPMPSSAAA